VISQDIEALSLAFCTSFLYNEEMTVTIDNFLGGKVKLAQSKEGYRATSDSVLLSSAVLAKEGESVLDVGTGNGVVLFCLAERVPNLDMIGVDVQSDLLELALQNNELNQQNIRFILGDISEKSSDIHGKQFHHVVTNPPFYRDGKGRLNEQQRIAFHEMISIEKWIRFCVKHIRAGGTFTMIHQMEALPEILSAIQKTSLGAVEVIPLVKDLNTPAKRIIIRAKLGSKKPFILRNPFVLHQSDGQSYTEKAEGILRFGYALDDK